MDNEACPAFVDIAGYLFCIFLDLVMIFILLRLIEFTGIRHAPLAAWLLLLAFILVIGFACYRLIRCLFPNWLRVGHSGVVLREVMEIEGRV